MLVNGQQINVLVENREIREKKINLKKYKDSDKDKKSQEERERERGERQTERETGRQREE